MSITLGLYTYNINFWFLKLGLLEPCNMSRQWNRIVISDFDPYTYIIVSFISILISYLSHEYIKLMVLQKLFTWIFSCWFTGTNGS
mgnify:CR=1 FL=1